MGKVVLVNVKFSKDGPTLLFKSTPRTERGFDKLMSLAKYGVKSKGDEELLLEISTGKEVSSPVELTGYTHFINVQW